MRCEFGSESGRSWSRRDLQCSDVHTYSEDIVDGSVGGLRKDYNLSSEDAERYVIGGELTDDGGTDDHDTFFRMASEFPVRTGLYTFGLPVFALLQLINGFVHDGSLVYIGLFAALVVAFSVLLTQYQVAVYRRKNIAQW